MFTQPLGKLIVGKFLLVMCNPICIIMYFPRRNLPTIPIIGLLELLCLEWTLLPYEEVTGGWHLRIGYEEQDYYFLITLVFISF